MVRSWSHIPLIRSPLIESDSKELQEEVKELQDLQERREQDQAKVSKSRSTNTQTRQSQSLSDRVRPSKTYKTSWFRHHEHSTNIELFYDLFFVANLTAFTAVHEVNDAQSLKGYVGFFCILWFTWYQVSLYEVRFGMDSIMERVGKAIQFMVMIVFAAGGPQYDVGSEQDNLIFFQAITLALMASRLVLVAEYIQVCWFARSHDKQILLPVGIIAAIYFVAAMIYLGLYWILPQSTHAADAWYVIGPVETAAVILVSITWRHIGFTGTHLAERMSLLTMILFGEGAIAVARAVQTVAASRGVLTFSNSVMGTTLCAVLMLYFMYLLYYDWLDEELFGAIRMQIWSFVHFLLHLAIALSVEGAAQCITWNAGIATTNALLDQLDQFSYDLFYTNASSAAFQSVGEQLNETSTDLFTRQLTTSTEYFSTINTFGYWYQTNQSAIPAIINGAQDPAAASRALIWMTGVLYNTVFQIAHFEPPPTEQDLETTATYLVDTLNFSSTSTDYVLSAAVADVAQAWRVFGLTFVYFVVSTGGFVLVLTVLAALDGARRSNYSIYRLTFMGLVGLGLALLGTVATNAVALAYYIQSSWLLPTITLCLFAILVVDAVRLPGEPLITKK